MFENRPSSISNIGHAVLIGVFVAIPLLMFLPNLIIKLDMKSVGVGDRVMSSSHAGPDVRNGIVESIHGDTAIVSGATSGKKYTLPISALTEL